MKLIYNRNNNRFIHGDNIEILNKLKPNWFDSCVSDFPYDLSFMGKKWDTTGDFYKWCYERATALFRVMKPGGYVCIFGHPKTNHRMKCAFEDAGFNIVEEIEWIYGTGFPKNQDIGKLFDKKEGAERTVVGKRAVSKDYTRNGIKGDMLVLGTAKSTTIDVTVPTTNAAIQWNGWKTSGLKPAHEPITIFQKPLEGTYIANIEKWGCGAMNIDACRIPTSQEDKDIINAKASKNPTNNYAENKDRKYGVYAKDMEMAANDGRRFPANVILDGPMSEVLDEQTGNLGVSSGGKAGHDRAYSGGYKESYYGDAKPGFGDSGGASRYFLNIAPFYYCAKPTKKEKGDGNIHITVKPKELIKWIIKLVTPLNGKTIDITAGSGTHAVACEELNKHDGYNLTWMDIEMLNTNTEPYCNIALDRLSSIE